MKHELIRQPGVAKSRRVTALSRDGGDIAHHVAKLRERRQGRVTEAASAAPSELAWTVDGQTTLSREATRSPNRAEIEAHEAVHRAQFDARGELPLGSRKQLESEAARGAEELTSGGSFSPELAAPPGMRLAFSPENQSVSPAAEDGEPQEYPTPAGEIGPYVIQEEYTPLPGTKEGLRKRVSELEEENMELERRNAELKEKSELEIAREQRISDLLRWKGQVKKVASRNSDSFQEAVVQLYHELLQVPGGPLSITFNTINEGLSIIGIIGTAINRPSVSYAAGGLSVIASRLFGALQVNLKDLREQQASLRPKVAAAFRILDADWLEREYQVNEHEALLKNRILFATTKNQLYKIKFPQIPPKIPRTQVISTFFQIWIVENASVNRTLQSTKLFVKETTEFVGHEVPDYVVENIVKIGMEYAGGKDLFITPEFVVRLFVKLADRAGIKLRSPEYIGYTDIASDRWFEATFNGVPCNVRIIERYAVPAPSYETGGSGLDKDTGKSKYSVPIAVLVDFFQKGETRRIRLI